MQNMNWDEREGNTVTMKKMLLKVSDTIMMTELKRVIWERHERHEECIIIK
jgi:hypothetical protein